MAGQSPEPSFQPSGQDPGLTQGRPAWQTPPPGYTPPGGASGSGQAYAASGPSYNPQDQAYQQDQTYTVMGQNPNQDYQDYQGYQGYQQGYQGYGAQQGQGAGAAPPQWHGLKGMKQADGRAKSPGEKGFVGSLFDFNFDSMVTPKIIKAIYMLVTAWVGLWALILLIVFFRFYGVAAGLFALIILDPIMILLGLGACRIVLEFYMITFKIHEEVKALRANREEQS